MPSDDFDEPGGRGRHRGGRFGLVFFERESGGTRYRLRFTRLALILVVFLTVIPCVAILALYYQQSRAQPEDVNLNIRVAPPAPDINRRLIQPAPQATPPPKVGISPRVGEPARRTPTAPTMNANAPPTPSPTPSPAPPKPPG